MSLEWWKAFFEIGGVALLALTFAFGAGALIVNNRLNSLQDTQLRQFNKDLTGAKTELGRQQERAANADARVAGLEQDVANAKTEMAKQQTRAATAERSLLELQQRLSHRRINSSDHAKFVAALRPYGGSTVKVIKLLESEAAQFADDIIAVFVEAQWHVDLSISGQTVPPQYGLTAPLTLQRMQDELWCLS
jgi:septal ring factor EnvC (AmiA/AmiB activator)